MTDGKPLLEALPKVAHPEVAAILETVIRNAEDRKLCRINLLSFAAEHGE